MRHRHRHNARYFVLSTLDIGQKFILHNFQFMAYYDYDPVKQGPYSRGYKKTCNDELSLKTGDFVVVHGEPKANGFYLAEVC